MAKKSTKTNAHKTTVHATKSNYGIVKVTAFWGIIISGFVGIVLFIIKCLVRLGIISGAGKTVGSVIGVFNLIANLALFVSVFLAAYAHSKTKGKTFKILFWIFALFALLAILGFNILEMV